MPKIQKIKHQKKAQQSVQAALWTVEQDIYLIENADLALADLQVQLPYSEEEIQDRKACLGLIRRAKQFRKFDF